MNKQKVFDKVATHLLTQKRKSMKRTRKDCFDGKGVLCMYRGPNGTMCAVGCLIKDKYYDPNLENKNVFCGEVHDVLCKSVNGFTGSQSEIRFMSDLQRIHDDHHPNQWKKELKNFAEHEGLKTKVLESF